jgi:hypothetical protein
MLDARNGNCFGFLRALLAFCSVLLGSSGCIPAARWYAPTEPRVGTQASVRYRATRISDHESQPLEVSAEINAPSADLALGPARLSRPSLEPCASGPVSSRWLSLGGTDATRAEHEYISAAFARSPESEALLRDGPTVLDLPIVTPLATGSARCLRVELLDASPETVDWRQRPVGWFGASVRTFVPVHAIEGMSGAFMGTVRGGPFIGPLRVGLDLGFGAGVSRNDAPVQDSGGFLLYSAGALLAPEPLVAGRFGFTSELGYDVYGLRFTPKGQSTSEGRGLVHGPLLALRFMILPKPARSSSFESRSDSWTSAIDLFTTLLWHRSGEQPTPAFGFSYVGDIGFP